MKVCLECGYYSPAIDFSKDDIIETRLISFHSGLVEGECPNCKLDSLIEIDEEIAPDIILMNMYDCTTLFSCSGHMYNEYLKFYIVTQNYSEQINLALNDINVELKVPDKDRIVYEYNPLEFSKESYRLGFPVGCFADLYNKDGVLTHKSRYDEIIKRKKYIHKVLERSIKYLAVPKGEF